MTEHEHEASATTEMWREVLEDGHRDVPSSFLPGSLRCGMCQVPMGSVGGTLMKLLRGRTPYRKNPWMCNL
ncbi:MAG: hypothetical protein QF357_09545 [Dehalococcoidia bacterium]|jgi:hypothetical protein|nr:hypothetical protein [Dehalococcoidia bacterium]